MKRGQRGRPEEPSRVDRQQVIADPLDLAQQVRGEDDGDPELGAGAPDEVQHLVAAGRVEPVGGLVEEQQPRVVDERLGELDALLHAGRVAADGPVALLVQADVPEDLGRPLASGVGRQAGDAGHVGHELGGAHVGGQAVVLGRVAHQLADAGGMVGDVVPEHEGRARGGRQQPEQDADERRLAGAVRPDQPDDRGPHLEGQLVERDDRPKRLVSPRVAMRAARSPDGPTVPAGSIRGTKVNHLLRVPLADCP